MKDFYQILEIDQNASDYEIKKAYRRLVIKYHPDKNQGEDFFTKQFLLVKEAYDILIDIEKRKEYDIAYNYFINQQTADQKQKEANRRERKKFEEKARDEKFYYEPFKPFYSSYDRDLQQTPQFKPVYDLSGSIIPENIEFFQLPKQIGKIIGAYSDLKNDEQPLSGFNKVLRTLGGLIIALLIGTIIVFLVELDLKGKIIWYAIPLAIALIAMSLSDKFLRKNLFVGINGFAEFTYKENRNNIKINAEINFNAVTDLYVYHIEKRVNFIYEGTDFIYIYLNRTNGEIIYKKEGSFDKNKDINQYPIELIFCMKTEQYWSVYLLDKMEENLQHDGFILFYLYSHDKNIFGPYIKLGVGEITFIKSKNEEFTYKFNEIKKIYTKGSELHIVHLNFQRNLFFFKSGNEDVIPLMNLCNRQFFYRAMEILLRYKI